jgi:hypothetical protein
MERSLLKFTCALGIILFALYGCKKEEPPPTVRILSEGKQITFFKIVAPAATGVIDTINKTIKISVPAGTSLTSLTTDISVATGHTISPASAAVQNFSSPVVFTVTRPDNTTTLWTVTVTVQVVLSPGKQFNFFKIVSPAATGVIDTVNKTITISVPTGTSLTSLTTDISLATGHTISPASAVAQNFTNAVVYTVTRPGNTTTTWTVTVTTPNVTVNQDITSSATWTSDKTYLISGDISIGNSSILTIQPGTVIKFNAGASLSIGYSSNATLIAEGTAANPITFTSSAVAPAAGAWEGLYFYSNTLSNSSLAYCNIQYAGSNTSYGALNLSSCNLAINNCNISNSGSYGIHAYYSNSKGGFVSFANNTINTTAKYGIYIHAQKLSTIGTGNTFTNIKGIYIDGDFNSNTAQTWKNFNVPYIVDHELDIDGNLTIEAGTTFKFEANGWLAIGYYATTTFIADGGSNTTPITFTSNATSPTAGAWKSIAFYGYTQTNSKMNYCIVDYAGSSSTYGAIDMNGTSSITFTNNIVRNSGSYGINMDANAGFQSFTNNTINSCVDHLIVISTYHLPELGSANTLTAATGKGIQVFGDARYTVAVTWKKQSADFYVTNGENDVDGNVTIEAGSKFLFVNDAFFWFGYYATTKITAVGTSIDKITFTSAASSPSAGSWKGLVFDDNYTQATSELNYCQFQFTGMSGKPAIYTGVSFPVSNTTISDFSSTNAAEYKTGITVPTGAGNNFTWVAN